MILSIMERNFLHMFLEFCITLSFDFVSDLFISTWFKLWHVNGLLKLLLDPFSSQFVSMTNFSSQRHSIPLLLSIFIRLLWVFGLGIPQVKLSSYFWELGSEKLLIFFTCFPELPPNIFLSMTF